MKGWTPTLTPEVSVEVFREAVAEVGVDEAAVLLNVSTGTIERWCMGFGTSQPGNQQKIELFVRNHDDGSDRTTIDQ